MRYAGIIRAEFGWEVVLVDCDGNPRIHTVKKWGVKLEGGLDPLDSELESLYRNNFVMLINPNEERPSDKEIARMSREKRASLSSNKSGT